ncbi:MAG: glutamine synthetase beta-grasp domain-containing protein [Acidobacteria bacterium]|nr:glutamine synthetase beta-grasp domain-containing protein [Acidobacteriota bacterium]
MGKIKAEYIWIDGQKPTAKLRSKTKILDGKISKLEDLPEWGYDGSSTYQAEGRLSDLTLTPVALIRDPIHGGDNVLALCEVFNPDGTPHESNRRARLREVAEKFADEEPLFGIEQEYTLFHGNQPLGWPEKGFPAPQGGYYCGVGNDEVYGREVVEAHMDACIDAGLAIAGINSEVMPAQWEFQIGPLPPLEVADQIWLGRWLLYRIGEEFDVSATLYPKPVKGDWNGAGAHTNFSTRAMREDGGIEKIHEAARRLEKRHKEHIAVYGAHNEERLTGLHETCNINEFRAGVSDRGASIRIPQAVNKAGKGYFEDRRPAANMDPYEVCAIMIESVCG